MSDNTDVEPEGETEAAGRRVAEWNRNAPPDGTFFRVICFVVNQETGELTPRHESGAILPKKVYDVPGAGRWAANAAQGTRVDGAELRWVVLSPSGRCIHVLAGGTGKPVKPGIALRTKRVVAQLMPSVVKRARRTSRPLSRSIAKVGRRRTSRRS